MREIKFRAWDKGRCKWLSDFRLHPSGQVMKTQAVSKSKKYEYGTKSIQNVELCQFTGLKDRNSKEIYEGDVVITPQQKYIKQWVVEYDYDGNIILSNQINSEICLYDFEDMIVDKNNCYVKDIEIIGNIYDNPELLTN